jgi:hypothetical protein
MDIMRTHPMVIIGGILQENPFFVPPDEFLEELRLRKRRKPVPSPEQDSRRRVYPHEQEM